VLAEGGHVADIGCGFGHSTMIMATAFPASRFHGFDAHGPSIDAAGKWAAGAGLANRVQFDVATAKTFAGDDYDLITYFDCLHDMGDPVGALQHARSALDPAGTVMLVEPFAADDVGDNINPVGRLFYAASTMVCTPASKSEEVGRALGAQAGEARTRVVAREAGFSRFRRASATPFNLVYELRP
jgi:2-polyprenyl-3-methyl-5-hydroxy-6-metoxy-1,4-benzoquinol methylase